MADPIHPATTIADAFNQVNPNQALASDDPRYVDFSTWRSPMPVAEKLARIISRSAAGEPVKILFTGHKGSGKSTELRRLEATLIDDGFFAVFFDVATEVDMGSVSYTDVLLAMMYQLVSAIEASDVAASLNVRAVDALRRRLAKVLTEKTNYREAETTLETTAEGSVGLPGLFKLMSSLKARLRGGETERRVLRDELDADIGLFLEELNDLIRDLDLRLKEQGSRGLVVIVDSLDRVILKSVGTDDARTTHSDLFIDHAVHLMAPACPMVYTIPVALLNQENVANAWGSQPELLPMVKVRDRDGNDCAEALDVMVDAVARRVDLDAVFEHPEDVRDLCRVSGGHLRDLMILLREALTYTPDDARVPTDSVRLAVQELANDKQRSIQADEVDRLVEVYETKMLPNRSTYASLATKLLVLEYRNSTIWNDVHPAVQRTALFQAALAEKAGREDGAE